MRVCADNICFKASSCVPFLDAAPANKIRAVPPRLAQGIHIFCQSQVPEMQQSIAAQELEQKSYSANFCSLFEISNRTYSCFKVRAGQGTRGESKRCHFELLGLQLLLVEPDSQ